MSSQDNGHGRGRSLDRFEQSCKRLDPPAWIRQQSPLPPLNKEAGSKSSRPRYSDHRRSYSAQRPSASTSFWRPPPTSRDPSPLPGSRPATAAGRFHGGQFSRWSASTLCSDGGQFSNGDNTPTDSVISAFSMRSSLHAGPCTEPIYHPPNNLLRVKPHHKPYLGWRSQDSLVNDHDTSARLLTPAERLAQSYKKRGSTQATQKRRCHLDNASSQQLVHDSIKSISTAIMEFCQAEDVPQQRPDTSNHGQRQKRQKGRIIWLESSFVSSANCQANIDETKSKL